MVQLEVTQSHGVIEIIIEQLVFDCLLSNSNFGKHVCTENKVILFFCYTDLFFKTDR